MLSNHSTTECYFQFCFHLKEKEEEAEEEEEEEKEVVWRHKTIVYNIKHKTLIVS